MSETETSAVNRQSVPVKKTGQALGRKVGASAVAGIVVSALGALASFAADGSVLPLKRISLDGQKQLVIEFANHGGGFPTVPHVLDLPGPDHRIVVDLAGARIEKGSLSTPEELTTAIGKRLPAVRGIRYYNQPNTEKPTARIVLDLPESVKAEPRVVKVDESTITIDLGNEVVSAQAAPPLAGSALTPQTPAGDRSEVAALASSAAGAAADAPAQSAQATTVAATPFAGAEPAAAIGSAATALVADAAVPAAESSAASSPAAVPASGGADASAAKTGGGWDWSGSSSPANPGAVAEAKDGAPASAPAAAASPPTAAAPAAAPAAPQTADNVDGVAPAGAAPTQVAQPADAAELRPAIGGTGSPSAAAKTAAPAAASEPAGDQPMSAVPAGAAATPVGAEPTASSLKAAVKLYNSAVRNHLAGKLSDAINDYKGAIAANPQLAEAHSNLGLIYNQQHNYQPALTEFRKALAINPKDAITYNGIGAALRAERDLAGAIKNWQTAVSLDPHLATAHYNLGTAYEIQKDYDRALDAYKEAVKNDYRLGEAYYRMGVILERKHQLDDAATQFKEALKISTDSEYSEDARQRLSVLSKGTQTAAKH